MLQIANGIRFFILDNLTLGSHNASHDVENILKRIFLKIYFSYFELNYISIYSGSIVHWRNYIWSYGLRNVGLFPHHIRSTATNIQYFSKMGNTRLVWLIQGHALPCFVSSWFALYWIFIFIEELWYIEFKRSQNIARGIATRNGDTPTSRCTMVF